MLQQDLIEEDVMILDTYSQIFVWVGREAREVEVKEALKVTQEYIRTDPSNRDLDSTECLQVGTHVMHALWYHRPYCMKPYQMKVPNCAAPMQYFQ